MRSMRLRDLATAAVVLLVLVVPGCAAGTDVPARDPDVTGVVVTSGRQDGAALAEASDRYFEGMSLLRGDPVVVRGSSGERIEPTELRPGDEVRVWVAGACAESYPVQCDVEAVQVLPS